MLLRIQGYKNGIFLFHLIQKAKLIKGFVSNFDSISYFSS
jgi:hypothetical protein